MTTINAQKVGLTLGAMFGLVHLLWSLVVALGLAQSLINWVLKVHMLESSHTVLPFSLSSAVTLVVVTSLIGFVVGYVFGTIWNKVQK